MNIDRYLLFFDLTKSNSIGIDIRIFDLYRLFKYLTVYNKTIELNEMPVVTQLIFVKINFITFI